MDPKLQAAVDALVEYAKPEAVLLFGSRARGDFDEWSDWDLFVIVPDDAPIRSLIPSVLQDLAWERARFPVDAVACCRSTFEAKTSDPNSLSHDVARDGVLLYGHLAP